MSKTSMKIKQQRKQKLKLNSPQESIPAAESVAVHMHT